MENTYKEMLKDKKIQLVFLAIIICEVYFYYSSINIPSVLGMYNNIIGTLYSRGILIILFLFILSKLMNRFKKNSVLLRYDNFNLWFKDIFLNCINMAVTLIVIFNIVPVVLVLLKGGLIVKDPLFLTMSIINQIISFIIISYIYVFIDFHLNSEIISSLIIFSIIYVPTYIIYIFRKMYMTPIDIVLMRDNRYRYLFLQTGIMILIFVVSIFLFKKGALKNKHKDIVWRD